MQKAWGDTFLPITDVNNPEVTAFFQSLSQEQQGAVTPQQVLAEANARLKRQHSLTIPIPENLVALMFVSMADLTGSTASADLSDGTSESASLRKPHTRTS